MKERSSANDVINSLIIGKDSVNWKHQYISGNDVACCDLDKKIIYSPKFGPIIDEREDALVRGKNIHEAAHARLTPYSPKASWSSMKKNVINALEDVRIETAVSKLNSIVSDDLYELNKIVGEELSEKLRNEEFHNSINPVNESLAAMIFNAHGIPISWNMSEKGRKYFEDIRDIFDEVKYIKNIDTKEAFSDVLDIAERVMEKYAESEMEEQKKEEKGQESNNYSDSNEENNEDNKHEEGENKSQDNKKESASKSGKESKEGKEDKESKEKGKESKGTKKESSDTDVKGKRKSEESEEIVEESIESEDKKKILKKLEEEYDGEDLKEEFLKEKLKKIQEKSIKDNDGYTAYTEEDEYVKAKENVHNYEHARNSISVQIGKLSNYVEESLKSMSRCQKIGNLERGKIDRKKLCSLSKSLTKKVFYKSKEGIDLNVAVSVLVDESGSIGYMKYELRTMAIAFAEVFQKLGINFEILGFTTKDFDSVNREFTRSCPIKMKKYKEFSDNYNATKYRLGSIDAEFHNVDGECLLLAYNRLKKEKNKRKIVFVLSDGEPYAGPNSNALCNHLKKVIGDIRKNHDEVYAFGIGTKEPENFYGKDYFVYLKSCSELGPAFFNEFKRIVAK